MPDQLIHAYVGTPKQKLKYFVTSQPFVDLMQGSTEEVILKKPEDLRRIIRAAQESQDQQLEEPDKMEQLRVILDKKMNEPGTKVQIKPNFSKQDGMLDRLQIVVKWGGEFTHAYAKIKL